ncbi:MAG: TonB-dependent receptor [Proteobacteria bacterium]|nr:TonB-dependent receptor [Pseudomonadota bacterium]
MSAASPRLRYALPTGAACLLLSHPVLAATATGGAEATAEQGALAEVVVTAQKREQRAQDVPISLSVMGGAELDKSSLQSVTDALGLVPGVAINLTGQGGETVLTIRGVTSAGPLFAGPSPIGYYLDSVPFGLVRSAVEPDANTYDLKQIEVLRGPQGTLYGASALNGVVRVLTNDADLNNFEFKARSGLSFTDGGAGNYRSDAAVNIPIVDGRLAARLVVGREHDSGWIDAPIGTHINDTDSKNVRLKIDALPTDDLSIKLSTNYQQSNLGAPPQADHDYSATTQQQPINTHFNAQDLKIDYQLSSLSISNSTAYFQYLNDGSLDIAPGVPIPPLTTRLTSRVFSDELNLTSKMAGPWRWSAGAFFRDARDTTYQTLGDLIPAPVGQADASKSWAVFGEVARRFADNKWELSVGGRYFHDDVTLDQLILFGEPPGTPLIHVTNTFHATTPRVVLSWFPDRDYTMYASYSEGFRSGFAQSELVMLVAPDFGPVSPDKLHNYEIGGKGSAFNGKLVFDAAVYYMKWDDIQETLGIPVPGSTAYIVTNVNGKSASGMGVDLAATAHLLEGLTFGINFSWNGLKEDAAVYSGGALLFPDGSRIDSSPAYTAGANLQYSFPFGGSGWTGQFQAIGRYTSSQTTTSASVGVNEPPVVVKSDTITTARVAFSVTAPAHWRVMLFSDNVGNNRGVPLASQTPYSSISQRPRTTGLQLDYSFK